MERSLRKDPNRSDAQRTAVDMIVVGSLGKNDVGYFLFGSLSEKVIRAKVPVLASCMGRDSEKQEKLGARVSQFKSLIFLWGTAF